MSDDNPDPKSKPVNLIIPTGTVSERGIDVISIRRDGEDVRVSSGTVTSADEPLPSGCTHHTLLERVSGLLYQEVHTLPGDASPSGAEGGSAHSSASKVNPQKFALGWEQTFGRRPIKPTDIN